MRLPIIHRIGSVAVLLGCPIPSLSAFALGWAQPLRLVKRVNSCRSDQRSVGLTPYRYHRRSEGSYVRTQEISCIHAALAAHEQARAGDQQPFFCFFFCANRIRSGPQAKAHSEANRLGSAIIGAAGMSTWGQLRAAK